jgi:DNA sulfur modification protein DndB
VLKEEYILTLSVTINAFGRLGACFYNDNIDFSILSKLDSIDWLRNNPEWIGRVFNDQGRIIGKEDSIIKICNLIKIKLGLPLTKEEKVKENEFRK